MSKIVDEYLRYKDKESDLKDKLSELRDKVIKGMTKRNLTKVKRSGDDLSKGGYGGVMLTTQSRIVYDVDKLRDALDKVDWSGELSEEILKTIITIDTDRLNEMFELGEIKLGDLDGCYEIKESEQLRVTR